MLLLDEMNGDQPDEDPRPSMAADVSATRLYLGNLPRDGMKSLMTHPGFQKWWTDVHL